MNLTKSILYKIVNILLSVIAQFSGQSLSQKLAHLGSIIIISPSQAQSIIVAHLYVSGVSVETVQ
jgi:hypothetical protein